MIRAFPIYLLAAIAFSGCRDGGSGGADGEYGWLYSTLEAIETTRENMGDSVALSASYLERKLIEEEFERCFLAGGREPFCLKGDVERALGLIERHGLRPDYDGETELKGKRSNDPQRSMAVLVSEAQTLMRSAVDGHCSLETARKRLQTLLDDRLGALPLYVFLYGARYTYQEFGRSMCDTGSCQTIEADGKITPDSIARLMDEATRQGKGVVREGDRITIFNR